MWTSVSMLRAGNSLQLGIYNYCPYCRLATLALLDVCGACVCIAYGFAVTSVVALALLPVFVINLAVDRVSRRCYCLLFGSCIRSAFLNV